MQPARVLVVRTWGDDLALAMQRTEESRASLRALVDDPAALDEVTHAVRSGGAWDDPFEAARDLAEAGNRGLWDGWTKAEAAHSLLGRAIAAHPGGTGVLELRRAQAVAEQASGDLGNWIANGRTPFDAVERLVGAQLDEVRALGTQVAAAAT